MKKDFQELKRKHLDEKLRVLRRDDMPATPPEGWVKAIRTALNMPVDVLAKRIGVTQSAVTQFETSEVAETITLSSLRKLARGLECNLVYALVPTTSLADIMKEQALRRARSLVTVVSSSMALEDQGISEQEQERRIEKSAGDLLARPRTGFWNEK